MIVVASVSCIYGLGSPEEFTTQRIELRRDDEIGELAKWFNSFLNKLQSTISQVIDTVAGTRASAEQAAASARADEDLIRHALSELDVLAPKAGEEATLAEERVTLRSAEKLECISFETERAIARADGSFGQRFASGNFSARYSQIASDSQIVSSSSFRVGTKPLGECLKISARVSGRSSGITISSNAAPDFFSTSHGRIDQEE